MRGRGAKMEKSNKPILILIIMLLGFQFTLTIFVSANTLNPPVLPYQPPKQSREELYQKIILSLLLPYIQKEVNNYYLKYLTYPPQVAAYTVHVLSTETIDDFYIFKLKLQVYSYTGPHIGVGLDNITVTVDGSGNVKVENFEHIESYKLPPNYKDMIKKAIRTPFLNSSFFIKSAPHLFTC
jgi:hypothetical protein